MLKNLKKFKNSSKLPLYQFSQQSQAELIKNSGINNNNSENIGNDISAYQNLILNFNHHKNQVESIFAQFNYETDIKPAVEHLKSIGFNQTFFTKLFVEQPLGFLSAKSQKLNGKQLQSDAFEVVDFVQNKLKIEQSLVKHFLLKLPEIFEVGTQEIENRIQFLKDTFGYSDEEVRHILNYYPQIINNQYKTNITEKLYILQNWIQMTPQQLAPVLHKHPWFLNINDTDFKTNLKTLTSRNFKPEQICQMIEKDPQFLTLNKVNFEKAFDIPSKVLNVPNKVYVQHMTNDPRLISICPTTLMPVKYLVMVQDYLIPEKIVREIYINYPEVFVKSIGSLKIKLKYLSERLNLDLANDSQFPEILKYNYTEVIRPRGEAILKTQILLPILEAAKMTEEEFIKKVEISQEEFNKIKSQVNYSEELDYKRRDFHKHFGPSYQKYLEEYNQKFNQ